MHRTRRMILSCRPIMSNYLRMQPTANHSPSPSHMRNVNMPLFENAVKNCSEHSKYSSAHVREHNPCTGLSSTKYNSCSNKEVCHYKTFFPYAFTPHGNIDGMNHNFSEYSMLKVKCNLTNASNVLSIHNTRPNKVRITNQYRKLLST
jgi:hypothetical protein